MAFKKAEKTQSKLRLACYGPSGAGKTVSGVRVLNGMCKKIAVIDTERGRAAKCASDWADFDVCEVSDFGIDNMVKLMDEAASEGYDGLVIDSLSHAWSSLIEDVERIAKAKYRGNTWSAWSEGTPKQRRLVNAIMAYPGHIWATMRSDTAWEQEKDSRTGKTKPVKVGLKPQQGKGIEYEFDFLLGITPEHVATVEKGPRLFQDKIIETPCEDFGKELVEWLSSGAAAVPQEKDTNVPVTREQLTDIYDATKEDGRWLKMGNLLQDGEALKPGEITVKRLKEIMEGAK